MGDAHGQELAYVYFKAARRSAAKLLPKDVAVSNASGLNLAWNMHVTSVLWWDGMELFRHVLS